MRMFTRSDQAQMPAAAGSRARGDEGFTLVETTVALSLTLVVAAGLLSMDVVTTKQTENLGHLSARTTEYAQDKMEQLLAMPYGNTTKDTTVFPAAETGGTGLSIGGSTNPAAPTAGYVDYVQQNGDVGNNTNWYYIRVWQVTSPMANMKQVTVAVAVRGAFAGGQAQQGIVTAYKSFPF